MDKKKTPKGKKNRGLGRGIATTQCCFQNPAAADVLALLVESCSVCCANNADLVRPEMALSMPSALKIPAEWRGECLVTGLSCDKCKQQKEVLGICLANISCQTYIYAETIMYTENI